MEDQIFYSDRFKDAADRELQVRLWQLRYANLITQLGELGTEVIMTRTIITDYNSEPRNFIRDALHEFIFPPQTDLAIMEDNSHDNAMPYEDRSRREDIMRRYDPSKVLGIVGIRYDDAGNQVTFRVVDLMGNSELLVNAMCAIHHAINVEFPDNPPEQPLKE